MAVPTSLERMVRQHDNDITAIYEMLGRIEAKQDRHDNRFDEIGADLELLKSDVGTLKSDVATLGDQMAEVLDLLRKR
ncbi:MAG: hypothetical protein ACK5LS_00165 [Propioniciclava sp.]